MGLMNQIDAAVRKSQRAFKKAEDALESTAAVKTELQVVEKKMDGLGEQSSFDYIEIIKE